MTGTLRFARPGKSEISKRMNRQRAEYDSRDHGERAVKRDAMKPDLGFSRLSGRMRSPAGFRRKVAHR
jgi:hypothetical protein